MLMALGFVAPLGARERTNLDIFSQVSRSTYQKLFRNTAGQASNPTYDFDATRSPAEALSAGLGGQCNTIAKAIAYELIQSGIPDGDIRIVSAVNNSSLDRLCRGQRGKAARAAANDGLSGHVFVLIKSEGTWFLVNSTTIPGSPPAQPFGPLGLELTPFMDPMELDAAMKKGPVQIPKSITETLLPTHFGAMTIFHSSKLSEHPLHNFEARRNLIASGQVDSTPCRYDGAPDTSVTPSRSHPLR
jgi:hypothetical protein